MLAQSEEIFQFLQSQSAFTNVIGSRLYPVVAKENVTYPFCIYSLREESPFSKDSNKCIVTLSVYYAPEKYKDCATFTDTCKTIIETNGYIWLSSEIGFVEEDQSIASNINFELI